MTSNKLLTSLQVTSFLPISVTQYLWRIRTCTMRITDTNATPTSGTTSAHHCRAARHSDSCELLRRVSAPFGQLCWGVCSLKKLLVAVFDSIRSAYDDPTPTPSFEVWNGLLIVVRMRHVRLRGADLVKDAKSEAFERRFFRCECFERLWDGGRWRLDPKSSASVFTACRRRGSHR